MDRTDIINAIQGCDIPWGGLGDTLTPYCGDQHNPAWRWNRTYLKQMPTEDLIDLYGKLKLLQEN